MVEAAVGSHTGDVLLAGIGTATARVVTIGRAGGPRATRRLHVAGRLPRRRGGIMPDLVKIDAEEHEPDVIAGMRAALLQDGRRS